MATPVEASEQIVPELLNLRKVVPVVGLSLLWVLESFRPIIAARNNRIRHALRNVALTLLNTVVIAFCFGALTIHIASETVVNQRGVLFLAPMSPWLRIAVSVVLLDLWTWAWHHCNHRISWLWRFHRVHHSDDAMDVTTAARFHPGELMLSAIAKLPFIAAIGIGPIALLIHETVLVGLSQFHHAAISLGTSDRILQWFIVTPEMHRIHHSRDREETNSNYASILAVWDRLFGTFRGTLRHPNEPTGLNEFSSARDQTVIGMLRTPLASTHSSEASNVTRNRQS